MSYCKLRTTKHTQIASVNSQGHARTVPMTMRQDPLAAAAELIVLLESLCKQPEHYLSYDGQYTASTVQTLAGSLVCTVGEISTWPSTNNVILLMNFRKMRYYLFYFSQVTFTVDIRAMDALGREAIIYEMSNRTHRICDRCSVLCAIELKHDANGVICVPGLSSKLKSATFADSKRINDENSDDVPVLMSGAGHDAMVMSHLTKEASQFDGYFLCDSVVGYAMIGMLFLRCHGGESFTIRACIL